MAGKTPPRTVVDRDAEAHARDGTVLRADVYRPDAPGRFPVIVERTPYNKSGFVDRGRKLAERGYVFVIQDVRGRYASDGEFQPGFYSADHVDAEDGYDAVEWAAALPWSNGRVGTVGSSYDGWTQLELAHTRPPHLEAMIPQAIAANLLDREMSAVLRLGRVLWWSVVTLSPDQRRRKDARWGPRTIDRGGKALDGARPRQVAVAPAAHGHPRRRHVRHRPPLEKVAERPRVRPLRVRGEALPDGGARPRHHRLVRPAGRRDQELHRPRRERRDQGGPRAHQADRRAVDPRRRPVGQKGRRGRLRPGRRARLLRGRRPLVPRVAQGRRVRPRGMAPRRAVRHGRQQVAGRGRLAPGPRPLHELLPPRRRRGQHPGRRRRAVPRGARGRAAGQRTSTIRAIP